MAEVTSSKEDTKTGIHFSMQAAYVRQYLEQVKQTQAQLAAQTGGIPAGRDQIHPTEAKSGSEGEKRLKTEHDWVAAPVKPEAQPKVFKSPTMVLAAHIKSMTNLSINILAKRVGVTGVTRSATCWAARGLLAVLCASYPGRA